MERLEVVLESLDVRGGAKDGVAFSGVAEDVDRVFAVVLADLLHHAGPVDEVTAGGGVYVGKSAVKDKITDVGNVGVLEVDDGVTTRMRCAEMAQADGFLPVREISGPAGLKGGAGKRDGSCLVVFSEIIDQVTLRPGVADVLLGQWGEDGIATRVIAVVVGIGQEGKLGEGAFFFEHIHQALGRFGKLRINDDPSFGLAVRQVDTNGATPIGVIAYITADDLKVTVQRRPEIPAEEFRKGASGKGGCAGEQEVSALHGKRWFGMIRLKRGNLLFWNYSSRKFLL